jgi:lipoprotein-anchoring transpeptidase ErfK/SrfK
MKRWLTGVLVGLTLAVAACGSSGVAVTDSTLPPTTSQAPATTQPCGDVPLEAGWSLTATAAHDGDLPIFDSPDAAAPARTLANPRLINNDPNAAVPLLFLVKDTPDTNCDWVEVYLPVRPNGSTGFVKRSDVTLTPNPYRIEVHLGDFRLVVYKGQDVIMDTTIAEASDNTPTPGGLYYTTELVKTPNPDGAYGPYAYGLSGFSEVLQTFNGGPGQLGIHGTNQPQYLGQKVSHGCIRLSNDDITTLASTLPLGVPVQMIA